MNKNIFQFFSGIKLEKLILYGSIILYFTIGLIFIQNYIFIINTDGVSYIHIAHAYINGNFSYAINGYWSPLYSLLLIPFLVVWPSIVGSLISIKIFSLLIGCLTFFGVYLLVDKLNFSVKFKAVTFITLIPVILYFAFSKSTPDLLVLTIIIFYLNCLLGSEYINNLRMGLLTGFFGALAFLSKSYVFFFFLVHFSVVNLDYWLKFNKNRKTISKNFILGLTVFLIISGVWVALISDKYDKLTIGTAGTFNYDVYGPESQGPPFYTEGLMKPYGKDAMSVWDDPSYLEVRNWSPLSSYKNFDYQIQIISNNLLDIFKIIGFFSILSIFIIILALFLTFKSSNKSSKNKLSLLSITILIYSAGYCLILLEIRYLWFLDILLLLLGLFSLKVLFEEYSFNENLLKILVFLFCFSFIINPIFNLYDISGDGKDIYNLAENLKKYDIQGSNIAANSIDWRDTLILSFYLDSKYYGVTKPSSSEEEISEELTSNNIKYYIWWQKDTVIIPEYKKLNDTGLIYPNVYRVSEI